jgi:hypothetical protein
VPEPAIVDTLRQDDDATTDDPLCECKILYTICNEQQVVIRMRQLQISGPVPNGGAPHRAIMMHTGHCRLGDGSLLRVDVELGRFVGTLYTPGMKVMTEIHGSEAKVHAWVDAIAARYPADAP